MPTDAFFNLDARKKTGLLESAINEFSALPYEKVSVFKIARAAKVSRSGFYYYFNDKEDVYKYLLEQLIEEIVQDFKEEDREKYDIFTFSKLIFHRLARMKGTDREKFMKQAVINLKPSDVSGYFEKLESCTIESRMEFFSGLSHLKISSDEELFGLICLIISSIMYALQYYFGGRESLKNAETRLTKMFDMIQYGIMK